MRLAAIPITLALAHAVSGHATLFGVSVNGVDQGDGRNNYIRSPPNNSPVKDLASPALACNVNGGRSAPSFVHAAAGDTITLEWLHENRGDDIIDKSHEGPILTYIAPLSASSDGTGAIWTKIAEDGFSSGRWAVDKLIANRGKNDVRLPAALAPGRYLIRQEIIAHHESDTAFDANPARGAQFYPACVQFDITGSGTAVPDQKFDFNKGYTYADPGIVFNLYAPFSNYKIPGPEVWAGTSSGGAPPAAPGSPTTTRPGNPLPPAPTNGPGSPVQPAPWNRLSLRRL